MCLLPKLLSRLLLFGMIVCAAGCDGIPVIKPQIHNTWLWLNPNDFGFCPSELEAAVNDHVAGKRLSIGIVYAHDDYRNIVCRKVRVDRGYVSFSGADGQLIIQPHGVGIWRKIDGSEYHMKWDDDSFFPMVAMMGKEPWKGISAKSISAFMRPTALPSVMEPVMECPVISLPITNIGRYKQIFIDCEFSGDYVGELTDWYSSLTN